MKRITMDAVVAYCGRIRLYFDFMGDYKHIIEQHHVFYCIQQHHVFYTVMVAAAKHPSFKITLSFWASGG